MCNATEKKKKILHHDKYTLATIEEEEEGARGAAAVPSAALLLAIMLRGRGVLKFTAIIISQPRSHRFNPPTSAASSKSEEASSTK